jgi:hypothetical protein
MEPVPPRSNQEVPVVHVSQSFTVNSCSTSDIRVVLNAADKVRGSFRIFRAYGYGDKELKLRVLDTTKSSEPSQPVLLDLGTVVNEASFDFTAGKSGDYLLIFENKPSSSDTNSQKDIRLKYEITNTATISRQDATTIA